MGIAVFSPAIPTKGIIQPPNIMEKKPIKALALPAFFP